MKRENECIKKRHAKCSRTYRNYPLYFQRKLHISCFMVATMLDCWMYFSLTLAYMYSGTKFFTHMQTSQLPVKGCKSWHLCHGQEVTRAAYTNSLMNLLKTYTQTANLKQNIYSSKCMSLPVTTSFKTSLLLTSIKNILLNHKQFYKLQVNSIKTNTYQGRHILA